jgi:hypothetical protein
MTAYRIPQPGTTISGFADKKNANRLTLYFIDK